MEKKVRGGLGVGAAFTRRRQSVGAVTAMLAVQPIPVARCRWRPEP